MSSAPLEPTLYALLPPALVPSLEAHLSLLSIHVDNINEINRVYNTVNPVIQGQLRNLLFRSSSTSTPDPATSLIKDQAEGNREDINTRSTWKNSLAYTSAPLRGAEYADACVRAVIALEIPTGVDNGVDELEEFVNALGFEFSHSYHLLGHLFHIPIPAPIPPSNPLTLHLSITRLFPVSSSSSTTTSVEPDNDDQQPYLIQLKPSRPVQAVSSLSSSSAAAGGGGPTGDIGLGDVIGYMNEVASGIEVVQWTTNPSGGGR